MGLGSAFDPELAERIGVALGVESAIEDVSVILGPGVNIKRSPCAGATSSTSPRTRTLRAPSPPVWCAASSRRAWARRSSTSRPTTRRPTGCASPPT
ncbi:hypothetical protein [Tessaracoccus coleopterorum]|uniref:hypothetical protein n=1 Tax=Tessaracoccus coleopterorum TaxID=2714950 RepID=UPI002F9132DB